MDPEDLIMIETEDCELYQLPDSVGTLYVGRYDHMESMGFFEINPNKEVPKRARPAPGFLKQMEGQSIVAFFDGDAKTKETTLEKGQIIELPKDQSFSVKNITGTPCLTFWKFQGNVEDEIKQAISTYPKLTFEARAKSGYQELYNQHEKVRQDFKDSEKEKKKGFFSKFWKK